MDKTIKVKQETYKYLVKEAKEKKVSIGDIVYQLIQKEKDRQKGVQ